MSHGRRLKTMDGIYKPSSAIPLLVDTGGGITPPPPPPPPPTAGAQAQWAGGPWYTLIDWTTAVIGGAGRTTAQWFGSLGHAYANSDHVSDAPANNWHSRNSDPMWTITGMFNGNVSVGGTASLHIAQGFYVPNAAGDLNANVWNHDTGYHYDFYGVRNINNTNHTATAEAIWQLHESTDGWATGVWPNGTRRGTRAAGCQFNGGAITAADWRAGFINHAIAFAANRSNWSKNGPALPARMMDSGSDTTYLGNVPLGTMFSIPISSRGGPVKPANMSTIGSMVWDAVQKYGMYAVDSTNGFAFYGDGGNDPVTSSWLTPLNGADGTAIVAASRMITRGKLGLQHA